MGHGNGFAKLHAHDGPVGSQKGAAMTVMVTSDRWRETLMASERVTPKDVRQIRYDNNRGAGAVRIRLSYQPVAAAYRCT